MRHQLSDFLLLLPLLFLPVQNSELASIGAPLGPRDACNGSFRRLGAFVVRRMRAVSRLFAPRTASEMHVIAAAAKAEAKTSRRPAKRRPTARMRSVGTLCASPRVRPQTT